MQRNFGGVIWTNHALTRMRERGIKQGDAWATWRRPDSSRHARAKGNWVYHRTFGNQKIEVVAKKNDKGAWLILSVWSKQISGEGKHELKKSSGGFLSIIKELFSK